MTKPTITARLAAALPVLRAVCGIVGIGMIGYGAWLHYPPLGFMVGGAMLALDGIISGLKAKR